MMPKIIQFAWKEMWNRRWSLCAYSLITVLFLLMYISIYPSVSKEAARFDELFKSYPKALMEAFNIDQLQLTTIEGYIAAEHFSFLWPLLLILLALSLAVGSIAGEIESGTMALLLSLPITRTKLFLAKYLAVIKGLAIFVIVSTLPMWPLAKAFGYTVPFGPLLNTFWLCLLFAWTIASIGFLAASLVSQKSHAYMVLGGGLLLLYVCNVVAGLVENLSFIKFVSPFYYFTPGNALMGTNPGWQPVIVFSAVAITTSLLALWRFNKRDIVVQ